MSSALSWDWSNEHVQTEVKNGENVSSISTIILAGPSRLKMIASETTDGVFGSTNSLVPIGTVQNISITSSRQVMRMFEIGSLRAYQIPGRISYQLTMSRIMFHGPSLLRALYSLAPARLVERFGTPLNIDPDARGNGVTELAEYSALYPDDAVKGVPGYGGMGGDDNRDFWVNLASEIFQTPVGLAMIMKDGTIYKDPRRAERGQAGLIAAE